MATVKQVAAAAASLTVTGLSTLASATYVTSNTKSNTTNQPLDVMVEATLATTNAPAGNKQVLIFAQASYDAGSTWQTGPGSGTTTTDEPVLTFVGAVAINTTATTMRKSFSTAAAYGGVLPPDVRYVFKNDLGVALTTGTVTTTEISATVA